MRMPRWALPVQLVLVPSVLAAGVTSAVVLPRDPAPTSRSVVAQAVGRITAIGTYRATFEMTIQGPNGLSVTTTGRTLVDTGRQVLSGRLEVPSVGSVELRQVGERGYIGLPAGRTDVHGNHWIGLTSPGASSIGAQDPLASLMALGGDSEVRELGHEEIGGVETTHYGVDVDVQRLIDLAQEQGAVTTDLPAGLADQFTDAHADLWVDEDDLPRRLRMVYSAGQLDFSTSFTFADFGGAVSVREPAASDVTMTRTPLEAQTLLQQALLG